MARKLSTTVFFWITLALTRDVFASDCVKNAAVSVADDITIGELREQCRELVEGERASGASAVARRIAAERQSMSREFSLTPHYPNYIIPISYMRNPNQATAQQVGISEAVDDKEILLQISIKFPLMRNLWDTNTDFMFAYTNRAWWQAYNGDVSKPFRETNYEPELFFRGYGGPSFLGVSVVGWDLGYKHQSNGRAGVLSRSWDRLFAKVGIDISSNLLATLAVWYRIPEDKIDDELAREYRYLGYGEVRFIYAPNKNTVTAMLRPGTKESGLELSWSYSVSKNFRIYAQYFNGYGENLLDYDFEIERFGVGFAINDYLIGG